MAEYANNHFEKPSSFKSSASKTSGSFDHIVIAFINSQGNILEVMVLLSRLWKGLEDEAEADEAAEVLVDKLVTSVQ